MIDLDKHSSIIEKFVQASIDKFKTEKNKGPVSIGIYCCPWAGWLTTNFNITRTLEETENNCPDFEFVEFDFLDLEGWQDEYESDSPDYKVNGVVVHFDHDSGDENLNELAFKFLEPIVIRLKSVNGSDFLLQMLDSRFYRVF